MNNLLKKYLSYSFAKFLIVGVVNTIIGLLVMFVLYNKLKLGYWPSTSLGYIIGGIVSYLLNKNYTFNYKEYSFNNVIKFISVLVVCYILAYSVAKKVILYIIIMCNLNINSKVSEQIAMILGLCIYTVLNYIGQRLIVFSKKSGI